MPKHQTPTSLLLRHYLSEIGLLDHRGKPKPWTSLQITELCSQMRIGSQDLGLMAGVMPSIMVNYASGRQKVSLPASLHFYLIQQWFREKKSGLVSTKLPQAGLDLI